MLSRIFNGAKVDSKSKLQFSSFRRSAKTSMKQVLWGPPRTFVNLNCLLYHPTRSCMKRKFIRNTITNFFRIFYLLWQKRKRKNENPQRCSSQKWETNWPPSLHSRGQILKIAIKALLWNILVDFSALCQAADTEWVAV